MKKKLIILLSALLVVTNCLYASAAPAVGDGNSETVIVDEETSEKNVSDEDVSEETSSEEENSEEADSEEKISEDKSDEELIIDDISKEEDLQVYGIAINEATFPDANFRNYVLEQIDTDHDKLLSDIEIGNTTKIAIIDAGVVSLKGIEYFEFLTELNCDHNEITEIDLSKNPFLTEFSCRFNKLTSLEIRGIPLQTLDCRDNQLTNLLLDARLKYVFCSNNQLTNLNVDNIGDIKQLDCSSNLISSLDISRNSNLKDIYVNGTSTVSDGVITYEEGATNMLCVDAGVKIVTSGSSGQSNYKVGDIIKFGHYEQDGNLENGKEEIEWEVLKVESDRVLVVSKYALDCKKYNEERTNVTWETCTLRKWLNNDFKNAAFTVEEQLFIPTVRVVTEDNPVYGTTGGNDTIDKIFCLSLEEVKDLIGYTGFYNNDGNIAYMGADLIIEPTQYAVKNGAYSYTISQGYYDMYMDGFCDASDVVGRTGCEWWLRTPKNNDSAYPPSCAVYPSGFYGPEHSLIVTDSDTCVRPALYISAEASKESVINIFPDISETAWYVNAVQYVYDNGIMAGKGETFQPNSNITREEFTQVLYSIEGKPAVTTDNPYSDVKDGWYKNSVLWAKENNIAKGKSDGTFGVGNPITRQDLALMLYQYAEMKGFDMSYEDSSTDGYQDTNKVSGYAKDPMKWAVSQGIISGKGNGKDKSKLRLDPAGKATRAECAAMIMKLLQANQ